MGAGAISSRTLYHAAINTAPNERLTDDQKQQAIDRLEAEMGFTGQPRIVVEHSKKGREHIHVVFLRIDTDRMVALPDSHNYRRHEIVARDLEPQFGHEHVQGAHIGREDQERPGRTPSHDEMQQAERSGLSLKAAKEQITRLWNQADSGIAFAAALREAGWVLARGDGRDFVVIDPAGEPHSLARRIEGAKAADVRKRMSDVDAASLPSVTEAKALQRSPSPPPPKESLEKRVLAAPSSITKPMHKGNVTSLAPRPVQTKAERITDVAKATVGNVGVSAERIRGNTQPEKESSTNQAPTAVQRSCPGNCECDRKSEEAPRPQAASADASKASAHTGNGGDQTRQDHAEQRPIPRSEDRKTCSVANADSRKEAHDTGGAGCDARPKTGTTAQPRARSVGRWLTTSEATC